MAKYTTTKGAEGKVYIGLDPVTRQGTIRINITDMTEEHLEAWLLMNPKTARQYVLGPPPQSKAQPEKQVVSTATPSKEAKKDK